MKIIPVIDLKGGVVVRGVAGQRALYRPIVSQLTGETSPREVAKAFAEQFDFRSIYVADLDAIAGAAPAWDDWAAIGASGMRLLIDAGTSDPGQARSALQRLNGDRMLDGIVVALETLERESDLPALVDLLGPEFAVFSLDLRQGQPATRIDAWRHSEPEAIVDAVISAGFRRLIVLDVAQVGTGGGWGGRDLCRRIRERDAALELISGGGIPSTADLEELSATGCDAALVASALHDGHLTAETLASWR